MAPPKLPQALEQYLSKLEEKASSVPPNLLVASAFATGAVTAFGTSRIYARYFRRIKNSDWVTPDLFEKKRWIKGVVARSVYELVRLRLVRFS